MADQMADTQRALAAAKAKADTVRWDWQKSRVWIDKECFQKCWHKIWRWVDVDSLTGQLMKHGFVNDDEDFHYIDPHKHWSPKQRADNLLNQLVPRVGDYGHYLLYMCIRDCDANPLGHGDAVKELIAYSKQNKLLPPASLTANGGSHGNPPHFFGPGRGGLRLSGQESIQADQVQDNVSCTSGSLQCGVPMQESQQWTGGGEVERDSPVGQGGQTAPPRSSSGATGQGGQTAPPGSSSGATGQGGQMAPPRSSSGSATGQGGQMAPPRSSSGATGQGATQQSSTSPSGEVGSIHDIVKQLVKQGKFHDIREKFDGVHFALPEVCLSEPDFRTSLFKFIVACLNSRDKFPCSIFIAGVDLESSNQLPVELKFDHEFITHPYLSDRLKRAVFVKASDGSSTLSDDDTSLVRLEFITVTPSATPTSGDASYVVAMATVMPNSRVCADKVYTYREPKSKGKGAVLTRVEDGILELQTATKILKLEDKLSEYCRRQNND